MGKWIKIKSTKEKNIYTIYIIHILICQQEKLILFLAITQLFQNIWVPSMCWRQYWQLNRNQKWGDPYPYICSHTYFTDLCLCKLETQIVLFTVAHLFVGHTWYLTLQSYGTWVYQKSKSKGRWWGLGSEEYLHCFHRNGLRRGHYCFLW